MAGGVHADRGMQLTDLLLQGGLSLKTQRLLILCGDWS